MINTTAIKLNRPEPLLVTWEMLRRCNLDCTYCESTRHDSTSSLPSLDELTTTFNFIKEYTSLYNSKRADQTTTNIDFTGGEPTVNPAFWPLLDIIKQAGGFRLSLTTNGTWGPNFTKRILEHFSHVTISWHAEAEQHIKDRTIANILQLHEAGMSVQANIMLHCDSFDNATNICEMLRDKGVRVNPVPIGDGTIVRKGWFQDADGSNRRTSHEYTEEQQNWFFKFMGQDRPATASQEGTNVGRACCGGRCTQGKVNGEWQEVKLVNNWFKDWYCTINWYFLHIEQQQGNVLHHQTCRATFDGIGPIGNLSDTETILNNVKAMLAQPSIAPIICPNQRCGCGMCVPKAKEFTDFKDLWAATTSVPIQERS